jgi:hypothetical protein
MDTVATLKFSVARGGSYIDSNVARSIRANPVYIQSIKEGADLDLLAPKGREQRAIQIYYKNLIRYALDAFKHQFEQESRDLYIERPIPLIVSGGTSLPKGFTEIFNQCLGDIADFPIPITEVRAASDPLKAVSKGLLIKARSEY